MNNQRVALEMRIIRKAWKDKAYKQTLLTNPKALIEQEMEQSLPDDIEIRVVEESAQLFYLRLPVNPDNLPEEMLDMLAAGSGCNQQCDHHCVHDCIRYV